MKTNFIKINILLIVLAFYSCTKESAPDDNNVGNSFGQGLFWVKSDFGCGEITVNINGETNKITSYYSGGAPGCGASGCAVFALPPGTYPFTAYCSGESWSSSITITPNTCFKMQLTADGGGGNNGSGEVMFVTWEDTYCGAITVEVNGQSGQISQVYEGGNPNCGASGCATFTLPLGTYSYYAYCSSKSWDGTFSVLEGQCLKLRLIQ